MTGKESLRSIFEGLQTGRKFSVLQAMISDELIRRYVEAVEDCNPIHRDCAEASLSPFGGVIAPPTIVSLFVLKAYRTDWMPPLGGIQKEQHFAFFAPIRPGDRISFRAEITRMAERADIWDLTFGCKGFNQRGELIVESSSRSLWGDFGRKNIGSHEAKQSLAERNAIADITTEIFSGCHVGSSLSFPNITRIITRDKIERYEKLLGISNPVHLDETYARSTVFGGIIAHGLLIAAYISEAMMRISSWNWVHNGRMSLKFLFPLRSGDTVKVRGDIVEEDTNDEAGGLYFDVRCINQHGQTVVRGTTGVSLADRRSA